MIRKKYIKRLGRSAWGYDVRLDGIGRRRDFSFSSRAEAEEALEAVRRSLRDKRYGIVRQAPPAPTLAELIEARLPKIANPQEHARADRVLRVWLALLPDGIHVEQVETAQIDVYVKRRKADGLAASSINRELNIIAAALHQAGEIFPSLRQWRPPRIPRQKVARERRERIISQEEYSQIVGYLIRDKAFDEWPWQYQARVRVGQIFQFAMATAMRHGEMAELKWSDIDWNSSPPKLIVHQGKTGKTKHVPITAIVREILEARKAVAKNGYVFSDSQGEGGGGNIDSDTYSILRRAAEACAIPYGKSTPGGFVLHDCRHTATTRLADAGLSLDAIGLITGHSAKELIAHYIHYHAESIRRAAEVLEQNSRIIGREADKKT